MAEIWGSRHDEGQEAELFFDLFKHNSQWNYIENLGARAAKDKENKYLVQIIYPDREDYDLLASVKIIVNYM